MMRLYSKHPKYQFLKWYRNLRKVNEYTIPHSRLPRKIFLSLISLNSLTEINKNRTETMKNLTTLLSVLFCLSAIHSQLNAHTGKLISLDQLFTPNAALPALAEDKGFYGMWTLSIEGGSVGWLEVHNKAGYLDADLLWIGGSVLPVANVYFADDNTLVVTRTQEVAVSDQGGDGRKHTITTTLKMMREGDKLAGFMVSPNRNGMGVRTTAFTGARLPEVPKAPDLSKAKYGEPINLFNGKNLDGWKLINPRSENGFIVENGMLVNKPVQQEGHHVWYGNLRTEQEFEDFNL
jgi:hypothetical protein